MSWWVYLEKEEGGPVEVERHSEGGTYAVGGITAAELNITYNYSKHYSKCLDHREGLEWLDGKKGGNALFRLESAIAALGTERAADYWAPTEGNAGYALSILLQWARQHPEAVFRVS